MPDSTPYYGDRATVMPDNTAALIHFSDQFAQLARQKQLEQREQQKEQQQSNYRVNNSIGKYIYDKNFLNNDHTNPQMSALMEKAKNQALEDLNNGGEQYAMQNIYDAASQLREYSNAINQIHQNTINAGKEFLKANPTGDYGKFMDLYATQAFSKKDANGNLVRDENGNPIQADLGELHPENDYTQQILNEHGQDLFPVKSEINALQGIIKNEPKQNPNYDNEYDPKTKNITSYGYKGQNIPTSLVDAVPDPANPKRYIAQTKSVPYSMDGKNPYVDSNGQIVKILPPELEDKFGSNNAIHAAAERMTRQQLSAANGGSGQTDTKGNVIEGTETAPFTIDRNSAYGDMLFKKNLYDIVNNSIKAKGYTFNPVKDESDEKKSRALRDGIAAASLSLRQHNSARADRALTDKETKSVAPQTNADGTPFTSNYDDYLSQKQTLADPITNTPIGEYIDVTKEDPAKLAKLTGGKINAHGHIEGGVQPLELNGRKYLVVTQDDNGNDVIGNDKETIDKDEADLRQIKGLPAKNKMALIPPKKTVMQKIKQAFTPNKKPSKIQGIEEGGLN